MGKKIDEVISRLKQLVHHEFYEKSVGNDDPLIIEEKENDGKAEVTCYMKNDAFQFNLEAMSLSPILKNSKCADGAIFELINDKECLLHIIECKKKVNTKKWEKIKLQFEGAILRARAILGVLENPVRIKSVKLYTAYREDDVAIEKSATPTLLKTGVAPESQEIDEVQERTDWGNQLIKILDNEYEHKQIQLDVEMRDGQDVGVKIINL